MSHLFDENKGKVDLLEAVYPIGSIYMSVNNTSPATLFGGTWEKIQDTFLLASGSNYSAGSTGGSATHTHDLSNVTAKIHSYLSGDHLMYVTTDEQTSPEWTTYEKSVYGTTTGISAKTTLTKGTKLLGSPTSSSNLPPYLAVNMWKRTA